MIDVGMDRDFADLTAKISRDRGFVCASYKDKCLRRRIAVRMRARGVHTYTDYARLLDHDGHEYDLLIDALTINVSKLFRNWDTFAAIDRVVVPDLWSRTDGPLRIWSAGCAAGEEAYSVAALFQRYAEQHGVTAAQRVSILGTDIDKASLAAAERGAFADASFADTPPALRQRYFSTAIPSVVAPEVRRLVRFERRDLLAEAPPFPSAHLILCRNVVIYFDRPTQERLFERFADTLLPNAFLVLGKVETLLGVARGRFAPVEGRERIFRRR